MNTDELRILLNGHGICEKLDDLDMKGLPDLVLFSGGHAIFIFTDGDELQNQFAKRLTFQLAPHFMWRHMETGGLHRLDGIAQAAMTTDNDVIDWLDYIEEENKDFDYLAKYSEES